MKENIQSEDLYFRKKAEEILKSRKPLETAKLSENETLKLVHELQVHQIQLELQNKELVRAKELASDVSEKYIELYDFAPLGYFTLSPKGEIIQLNFAGAAMLCKERSQLKNRLFHLFLSNDSKPVFHQFREKVFDSLTKQSCELTLSINNNPPVFIHVKAIAFEDEGNCLITAIDITDLKILESNLLEQKVLLEEVERVGKIGGWAFNTEFFTQTWTKETFDILEIDPNEGEPKVPEGIEFIDEPYKNKAKIALQHAIEFGEPFEQEWLVTTAKGNKRWVNTVGKARLINNKVVGLFGSFQDITERKKNELALSESNEFNLTLMKTIPFGMDIVDENGTILYLNEKMKQHYGEYAVGKKCWEFYKIDKKQCPDCPLQTGIKLGETKTRKFHGKLNGKTLEVAHTGMMYYGKKAMLEVFTDTTERDKAETLLQESEEKYHAIFENIQDVFYQTDPIGTVLEVSPSFEKFTGFSRDEIIGKSLAKLFFDFKSKDMFFYKLKENGELTDYEIRVKTKNLKFKYTSINARLIFDSDGKPSHIDGAIRDITERKLAKNELQASKDFLKNIIDAVASPVFVKDENSKFILVNNAFCSLFNLPLEKIIGTSGYQFIPEEQMNIFIAKDKEVFDTGIENINEEIITDGSGKLRTIVSRKTLYTDSSGNKFLVGISNDITKSKLTELQIKKLNRVYSVLSNINQTIVRIHDRQFLFDEACRIAVESGGFIMSFVGMVNSTTNKIDVVASSGKKGEFLNDINIDLNDKKLNSGPAGLAIKTGKCNFSNNIETDDREFYWRDKAFKYGYRSMIALPLIVSGKAIGVYMIYSDEIDSFNKDEIKLLEELASDISFALEFIDNEKERKRAEEKLKENNSRLELAMNSANMAWWEMDLTNGKVTFDKRKSEMIGYPAKKFKHYNDFVELLHPEDSDKTMKAMQQYIDGLADKYETEYRILTQSGEYKWFYDVGGIAKKDPNGRPLHITGLVIDITRRKQSEQALMASEKKYHTIFNNVQDVFYQTNLAGTVLDVSPSIKNFSDFNRDEIVGKPVRNIYFDPTDRIEILDLLTKKGELRDYELRLKNKTGKIIYTSINARLILDAEGKPSHIDGAIRDITDRKLMQEKLVESEERFKLAMQASKDGLFDWNLETNEIYFSPGWKKIIGYKDHELPNDFSVWEELTEPLDVKKSWELLEKLISKKIARYVIEFRMKHKDGHWVDILSQAKAFFNKNGKAIRIVGTHTDISERKQAEESLMKLKTAIEKSEVSVVITDNNGIIEYANPFFSELTGFAANEYLGKKPEILKSGHQTSEFYNQLWDTIKSGNTWEGEFYNRKKNGEFYWENAIISPIENDKRQITHFVAVKTDITERKQINSELLIAKHHAEESDRLKSAFLANMSHEIRTPMNGILGFAELLKEPNLSIDVQKYYISIIEKSGDRLLNIINDIIDISKIEAGQMKVKLSMINANEYLEYILGFFKPEAEIKNIKLKSAVGLPLEKAFLTTDSDKFYAILINLVKNALKYTETGFIEIGYVFKLLNHKKNHIPTMEFYVKDTGIGIPYNRQEAIFERFIQADIVDKMARQGAGLGLSISKAYIEMLGGKIWVESEEEDLSAGKAGGSTFYFTHPLTANPNSENTGSIELLGQGNDIQFNTEVLDLKILIVEDDESSGKFISIEVMKFGSQIINVQNGVQAVEACRNNPDIDLVLMDIQMPEMNGYEATRQIREFNKNIIIIALTAFAMVGDKEKAIEAGCSDYISKPIKSNKLESVIGKYFTKRP